MSDAEMQALVDMDADELEYAVLAMEELDARRLEEIEEEIYAGALDVEIARSYAW